LTYVKDRPPADAGPKRSGIAATLRDANRQQPDPAAARSMQVHDDKVRGKFLKTARIPSLAVSTLPTEGTPPDVAGPSCDKLHNERTALAVAQGGDRA
jgi:hypothetical protein